MSNYNIGLFDDDDDQLSAIKRTINPFRDANINFKIYKLLNNEEYQSLLQQIREDIINENIDCLIIDYQIVLKKTHFEGTQLFEEINRELPKFPIIILTQKIDDCLKKTFVDSDKLYIKQLFLKASTPESKKMIEKIFRNIDIFIQRKSELQKQIKEIKVSAEKNDLDETQIEKLIKLENELDSLIPIGVSEIEKVFKAKDIENIIELLDKAQKIVED